MDISQRGIDLIFGSEGKKKLLPDGRYEAYLDKLAKPHVWTIYAGLTKGVYEGMVCTAEEGNRMFAKECAVYEDAIERLVTVPLNQNMFDSLTSFVYNCGVGALQNSTLLKLLNQGKYEQVPAQLMRWTHAGGVEYPGLVTRRKAEGALFIEPMPGAVEHPIPQKVEEAPAQTTAEAVKQSATIKTVAVAAPGPIYALFQQGYDWLFGVAKDAGAEVVALKSTYSPLDALGHMTPKILLMITVAALIVVAIRKIAERRAGTSV